MIILLRPTANATCSDRLADPAQDAETRRRAFPAPRLVACLECGGAVPPGSHEFCGAGCRKGFNNRRMVRGAALYDLYMAHRFDRPLAAAPGLFQAINRLASIWREEDREKRAGRRSWRRPQAVLGDQPHLKGARFRMRAGR